MRNFLKKSILCLLTATMLLGSIACTQTPSQETEAPTVGVTEATPGTAENVTEAETDAIPEVDRTKPQTGPFHSTTELSFEKQNAALIDKVITEEYEFISVKESSSIFSS